MYKVAVIGAAGFTGIELVRLIIGHPEFELVAASSDADAGKQFQEVYPFFAGRTLQSFETHEAVLSKAGTNLDLVFLAVPHTTAMGIVPELLEKGVSVIDLSADFRLQEATVYKQWYGTDHSAPELLEKAVYGLPEINRQALIAQAYRLKEHSVPALVANPGCYPTASALAALPIIKAGLFKAEGVVVINAISGVSGAGRKATETTHYCLANENVNAYGATTHRHTPEIAQTLSRLAYQPVQVVFTPHLAPLSRGMIATVTIGLSNEAAALTSPKDIQDCYEEAYSEEPFVQVLPLGIMPKSSSVARSNQAQVGVAYDETTHTVVASCAIDNLGKGAASQAIQCANILFTLDETSGLDHEGGLL